MRLSELIRQDLDLLNESQSNYYHGSYKDFDKFNKSPAFFSQSKEFAKLNGPIIYTVELNISKTFEGMDIFNTPPNKFGWDVEDNLTDIGKDLLNVYNDNYEILKNIYLEHWDIIEKPETLNILKQHGYDSFYIRGDGERNIGVLDLNKIKIINKDKPEDKIIDKPEPTIQKETDIIPEFIDVMGQERPTRNSLGNYIGNNIEAIQRFYKWFGNSKIVDNKNRPIVVYHGSVQTFDKFDISYASTESDMGAGFYFTNMKTDANKNYFKGGPDFENKVARMVDKLVYDNEISYKEAEKIVRKQLIGKPSLQETYLKIKNPVFVGGKNKTILFNDIFDDIEINREDYDNEDDYYDAVNEARDEALQTLTYDLDDYFDSFINESEKEKVKQLIFDAVWEDEGIDITKLKEELSELYIEDMDSGDYVGNEVVRLIIQSQGYDGIIDTMVSEKFSNMNLSKNTIHFIVFNSNQIKSIKNVGKFSLDSDNIFESKADKKTIKAYHGSPYKFNSFKTQGHSGIQTGLYSYSGISFTPTFNLAKEFAYQIKQEDKEQEQKIKDDFRANYPEILEKIKFWEKVETLKKYGHEMKDFDKRKQHYQISNEEQKIYDDYLKNLETQEKKMEDGDSYVYEVLITGDRIIYTKGDEIGFGGHREELINELDNEILFIKDADTGVYIGDEIIVNDPNQIKILKRIKI